MEDLIILSPCNLNKCENFLGICIKEISSTLPQTNESWQEVKSQKQLYDVYLNLDGELSA